MALRHAVTVGCLAAVSATVTATALAATPPTGVAETCAGQSSASFVRAFTNRDNLVVGPLALMGAGQLTPAETVRRFNGNKFPLVVAAGHRVTLELTRRTRRHASLGYGPLDEHPRTVRDGHRVVAFRSCDRDRDRDRDRSDADGRPVTFWSGFVLTDEPRCVHLRVWVDAEPSPRHAAIPLGRRCA
jgi:hypothetical protein